MTYPTPTSHHARNSVRICTQPLFIFSSDVISLPGTRSHEDAKAAATALCELIRRSPERTIPPSVASTTPTLSRSSTQAPASTIPIQRIAAPLRNVAQCARLLITAGVCVINIYELGLDEAQVAEMSGTEEGRLRLRTNPAYCRFAAALVKVRIPENLSIRVCCPDSPE